MKRVGTPHLEPAFSLLEVVAALAVLGVAIIGIAAGLSSAVRAAAMADRLRQALEVGEALARADATVAPQGSWWVGDPPVPGPHERPPCTGRVSSLPEGARRWTLIRVECELAGDTIILPLWVLR